jgi:hypothetical protein
MNKGQADRMSLRGRWHIKRFSKHGILLAEYKIKNQIVDAGMNYLLGVGFNAVTALNPWYIGLIDSTGFTAVATADTLASHAGWSELTAYSNATRPTWTSGAAAARAITNGVAVNFNMNATNTVKGLFIASDNVKGGTTGTLWSAALFGSPTLVNNTDVLAATYSLSG